MHIRNNIESIRICDREYPELLKNIKDPPDTIYFAGDIARRLCCGGRNKKVQ